MPQPSESVASFIAQLDKEGNASLKLHFPKKVVSAPKQALTKAEAAKAPTFSIAEGAAKPGQKYIIVGLDLDAPFPSFPIMSPVLHSLEVSAEVLGSAAAGWYAVQSGEVIFAYIAPGPPPGSGPHRYVFAVYEQPAGSTAESVKKALGLGTEPSAFSRPRWDQADCETKLGLGKIVAGNYWTT